MQMVLLAINAVKTYGFIQLIVCQYFFADKRRRNVATLHCGRKGLEKKIIKNLVKIFDTFWDI